MNQGNTNSLLIAIEKNMNKQVNQPNPSNDLLQKLNVNRITEDKKKEAIVTMGMSACQVRCLSHGCNGHYHSKH